MGKCRVCGKTVLMTMGFGNVILCRNCGTLINAQLWKDRNFSSSDELIQQRNCAIQMATGNRFPQEIVQAIEQFFDEYFNAGFVTTINGRAGQILKVFLDYCIVITKNESAKTSLESVFSQNGEDDEAFEISKEEKQKLISGLLSGKLVQTGIGAAVSIGLNQQEKEKAAERKAYRLEQLVAIGEHKIYLRNISQVDSFSKGNVGNGYLKFVPNNVSPKEIYECEYFFFNNAIPFESKKIKTKVESIKSFINDRIELIKNQSQEKSRLEEESLQKSIREKAQQQIKNDQQEDSFDRIRKYKQLLDEGIISEEEFAIKKKELLGL